MHVRLHSLVLVGLHGQVVDVEVDVGSGFPQFLLVGLADTVVQEARERVRSAIKNCGYRFPEGRVTVSLSPSHVRKEGAWFDLPIALGMLLASGQVADRHKILKELIVCGELGLDGTVRATGRELAQALGAGEGRTFMFAKDSMTKLAGVHQACLPVGSIHQACEVLESETLSCIIPENKPKPLRPAAGIQKLVGMESVERALRVAMVGRHHILLYGPPGTGKSAVSQVVEHWLPDLSSDLALEVGRIWSTSGVEPLTTLAPPFRSPHHTASCPAMVGGGHPIKTGEISLSHHGVLFLDELPEFRREVLEALREPLQEERISINRANQHITFPAACQVIATLNPCPCGFWGDQQKTCVCSAASIERYRRKLSGPLLDRFPLCVRVDRVDSTTLLSQPTQDYTPQELLDIRHTIQQARELRVAEPMASLRKTDQDFLAEAAEKFSLSARAIQATLQVAGSIAALDGRVQLCLADIAEALQYRWRGWEQ